MFLKYFANIIGLFTINSSFDLSCLTGRPADDQETVSVLTPSGHQEKLLHLRTGAQENLRHLL